MRSLFLVAALACCLWVSTNVYAQPVPFEPAPVYVCTADAQVLRLNGASAELIWSETGSFDDCVVGPDGWLYLSHTVSVTEVSSTHGIVRFDPAAPTTPALIASLSSQAKGLAFNVTTLYFTTTGSGVKKLTGAPGVPLDFAGAAVQSAFTPGPGPTSGQGLAFDVSGDLVFASGATVQLSATPQYVAQYANPTAIPSTAGQPRGVAVNTCDNILYTDIASQIVRRLVRGADGEYSLAGTGVSFGEGQLPLNIEIDSSNRLYILVAQDELGTDAAIVIANPEGAGAHEGAPWITTCSSYTEGTPVELKNFLEELPGLISARAVGLAIGPTAHALQHTFQSSPNACQHEFNFGYHTATLYFDSCPGRTIGLTAHKNRPSDVQFAPLVFPPASHPNIRPVAYSPLGGFATELILTSSPPGPVGNYVAKYSFFTQQPISRPGLAKATTHQAVHPWAGAYDVDVAEQYFWDFDALDPSEGEKQDDFSKRVAYTSDLVRNCTWAADFDQPLNGAHPPPFNSGQTLKVAIKALGQNCVGGTVRVSLVRIDHGPTFVPQIVTSNVEHLNVMTSLNNGTYRYLMNVPDLPPGVSLAEFQLTISGDVAPPKSKRFRVRR